MCCAETLWCLISGLGAHCGPLLQKGVGNGVLLSPGCWLAGFPCLCFILCSGADPLGLFWGSEVISQQLKGESSNGGGGTLAPRMG